MCTFCKPVRPIWLTFPKKKRGATPPLRDSYLTMPEIVEYPSSKLDCIVVPDFAHLFVTAEQVANSTMEEWKALKTILVKTKAYPTRPISREQWKDLSAARKPVTQWRYFEYKRRQRARDAVSSDDWLLCDDTPMPLAPNTCVQVHSTAMAPWPLALANAAPSSPLVPAVPMPLAPNTCVQVHSTAMAPWPLALANTAPSSPLVPAVPMPLAEGNAFIHSQSVAFRAADPQLALTLVAQGQRRDTNDSLKRTADEADGDNDGLQWLFEDGAIDSAATGDQPWTRASAEEELRQSALAVQSALKRQRLAKHTLFTLSHETRLNADQLEDVVATRAAEYGRFARAESGDDRACISKAVFHKHKQFLAVHNASEAARARQKNKNNPARTVV